MREILIACVLFLLVVIAILLYWILCRATDIYRQNQRIKQFCRRWSRWAEMTDLRVEEVEE